MTSAKQAYIYPVRGEIKGDLPKWISGSLYRIGPAKFEVGSYKYNHLFDGLGMVQRYWFNEGQVMFNSQYVHSDTYMKNMIANRIVVSEFGTMAFPDPCQSIFSKLSTMFDSDMTDNTSVCVYPLGDELFSATETNVIHRINPEDLSTLGSVRLDKILSIHRATAHQHIDADTGLVHLLGFINSPPSYALVTLPPIKKEQSKGLNDKYDMEKLLLEARIVTKVNTRWKLNPSYHHSFGITENYYVLLECPLTIGVVDILTAKMRKTSFVNVMKWWPQEKTKVIIINRQSGEIVPHTYLTDALFTFHHINAYEENDHLIIDYSGYDDGSIVTDVSVENMGKPDSSMFKKATARRLVIPLKVDIEADDNENLNKFPGSNAAARRIAKNNNNTATIYCSQEQLASDTFIELPAINYKHYNGKKYRYTYGIETDTLVKIDVVKKETIRWKYEISTGRVGEAIFLSDPNADAKNPEDEDFGVLLFPVIHNGTENTSSRYQSLIIVDAKSMKELARAEFPSVSIPMTFHGSFLNNSSLIHE